MNFVITVLIVGMCIGIGLIIYTLRHQKPLSNQELIAIIDERIAFHTRSDDMEQIIFGDQNSVWNAPQYSKLKGAVSEHLREAELDSVIVLIEHQRLKSLQIEELKLKLELMEKGGEHNAQS